MASISSPGIGSSLNVTDIVNQLLDAERTPKQKRLDLKEGTLQAQLSAFGTLKSALSSFQSAVQKLDADTDFEKYTASVANSDLFTATTSSVATAGNYSVEVSQLAQAHGLASAAFANSTDVVAATGGTLTFNFGSNDYDPATDTYSTFTANPDKTSKDVVIKAGSTLEDVRDAINTASIGVRANIVNDGSGYVLTLVAEDTGADNSLNISSSGDAGLAAFEFRVGVTTMEQTLAAKDASLKIDGLAVTRDSNTVTGVINGVTLNLLDAGSTTLNVSQDTSTIIDAVDGLVSAYNDVMNTIKGSSSVDAGTGGAAVLVGDSTLRAIASQFRNIIGSKVSGIYGPYRSLVDLGVTTQDDGSLKLDAATLQSALEADPSTVAKLFTSSTGYATRFDDLATSLLEDDGLVESRITSLNDRIDGVSEDRLALEKRLQKLEERLLKQFTALDVLMGQLNQTSSYLTQQLDNLPTIGGKK